MNDNLELGARAIVLVLIVILLIVAVVMVYGLVKSTIPVIT